MTEREPTIIIIKGIRPGMPAEYFQESYGDILVEPQPLDMKDDETLDWGWDRRN
jgi:hypothetical protein